MKSVCETLHFMSLSAYYADAQLIHGGMCAALVSARRARELSYAEYLAAQWAVRHYMNELPGSCAYLRDTLRLSGMPHSEHECWLIYHDWDNRPYPTKLQRVVGVIRRFEEFLK